MKAVLETITPKKAAEMLTLNTKNRPCSMRWAEQLAEAIRRGEWKLNGDTIKLNGTVLVDGQHRLHAIVKAGLSVQSYVIRGVESDAFDTIDQGRRRTSSDMLARSGEKYYCELSAACRFLHYYGLGIVPRGIGGGAAVTPTQIQKVLDKNPLLRGSIDFLIPHKKSLLISVGLAAALHYLCASRDAATAESFFTQLGTGENINRQHPVYVLRERLRRNQTDQAKLSNTVLAAFVIKAWNATRANSKLHNLRLIDGEDYPEVA